MNYIPFPKTYWTQIESVLNDLKQKNQKIVAAFDADGTLWDTDLGENFFNYQIDQKHVPLPNAPFDHYIEMKKLNNDPRDAYVWLAQINKGLPLEKIRQWSAQAFEAIQPKPIFQEQQKLIDLLKSYDTQIYIVTASIKWAVEPGAVALGLTADQVIGVETVVDNGIITDQPVLPITYRAGKVEALLKKTKGFYPFLCSGNSSGDIELLQAATHLRLAVSAASRDDKLFKSEKELTDIAVANKWMHHRFI